MNTIKMFWAMLSGLFFYNEFESKEEFWDWYWEQIPDKKYPSETLWETWETFRWCASLGGLRFNWRMWYNQHLGQRHFGYSWTFDKNGYFVQDKKTGNWWFTPDDGSFSYGCVGETIERLNGNPIFAS